MGSALRMLLGHHAASTATIHREAAFQRVPALPLTTRIHAWTADGVLWRLLPYPDRASALVTALLPDGATDASPETPAAVEDVVVAVEWDGQWERHWVRGLSPLLFLRPTDSSQA